MGSQLERQDDLSVDRAVELVYNEKLRREQEFWKTKIAWLGTQGALLAHYFKTTPSFGMSSLYCLASCALSALTAHELLRHRYGASLDNALILWIINRTEEEKKEGWSILFTDPEQQREKIAESWKLGRPKTLWECLFGTPPSSSPEQNENNPSNSPEPKREQKPPLQLRRLPEFFSWDRVGVEPEHSASHNWATLVVATPMMFVAFIAGKHGKDKLKRMNAKWMTEFLLLYKK